MDNTGNVDASGWADRACNSCRQRRVKCDKRLPGCQRCEKLGRPCTGYDLERKFLDEGVKVRKKYDGGFHPIPHAPRETVAPVVPVSTSTTGTGIGTGTTAAPGKSSPSFMSNILIDDRSTNAPQFTNTYNNGSPPFQSIPPPVLPSPHSISATPPTTSRLLGPYPLANSDYPLFGVSPKYNLFTAQATPPESGPATGNTLPPFQYNPSVPVDQDHYGPSDHPTAKLLQGQSQYAPSEISLDYSIIDDYFDLDIDTYYANGNNACGFIPGLPVIATDAAEPETEEDFLASDYASVSGRSSIHDSSEGRRKRTEYSQKYLNERATELTCLTRHFVQAISPWMDLFDLDTYFSRIVPVKAVQNVMLRSAMAAVAANQIGQLLANKTPRDGLAHLLPIIGADDGTTQPKDWFYKAANYYDRGISYLRIFLQRWLNNPGNDLTGLTGHTSRYNSMRAFSESSTTGPDNRKVSVSNKRRRLLQEQSSGGDMEALLAAISVLSLYETLDSSTNDWSQHLDGFKALLETKILPQAISAPHPRGDPYISMKAGRAAFWNFARADYLAAYVHRTRTRLDTENLTMWRAAGLPITEDGVLKHGDDAANANGITYLPSDREDSVACSLIWIVLRVMNFVAQGAAQASPIQTRIAQWNQLRRQLEEWFDNLPFTFQPYATMSTSPQTDSDQPEEHKNKFVRLFFSVPMCAAALQLYHFAQIVLLPNQPVDERDNSNLAKRIQMMRNVSEASNYHSRQICGIALGKPPPAVSRQMVHSLYLAGLCFEEDEDRRVVLELLQNIERETGASTVQRVRDLREQWGWQGEVIEIAE